MPRAAVRQTKLGAWPVGQTIGTVGGDEPFERSK
jgi:hypothetical protein